MAEIAFIHFCTLIDKSRLAEWARPYVHASLVRICLIMEVWSLYLESIVAFCDWTDLH